MSTGEKPPKRGNGQRGPDRKPRKGSPRVGKPGSTARDESPSRARRAKALELLAAGQRVDDVAREVGVTRAAVYRWLDDEVFAAELDRMLEVAKQSALRILRGNAEAFARTLADVATTGDAVGGRVQAAKDGLDRIGLAPPKEVRLDVNTNPSAGKADDDLERDVRKAAEALGIAKP